MHFKYKINSDKNEVTLTGVEGECPKELIIPEYISIDGKQIKVTGIRFGSLCPRFEPEYGSGVTCSVIHIPQTVNDVIFCNSQIEEIFLPKSLTEIGMQRFYGCKNLKAVHIPNGLKTIGMGAFDGCSSLQKIIIPSTVTEIEGFCFKNCHSLKTITIPAGVNTLNNNLFENCYNLCEVVTENQNVTFFPTTFHGCKNLHKIDNHLIENGLLYNLDKTELYTYLGNDTNNGNIIVPASVRVLGDGFASSPELISIDLSETQINTIYQNTFRNCVNLQKVILPSTIKSIGARAFLDCIKLSEINLPNSIENIGVACFKNCALTEIIIPNSLVEISQATFIDCSKLCKVYIPMNVKSIDCSAFRNCRNIQQVTISKGYQKKLSQIFEGCNTADIIVEYLDIDKSKRTGAYTHGRLRPCPYCGSNDINIFIDGTAVCNTCNGEYHYQ